MAARPHRRPVGGRASYHIGGRAQLAIWFCRCPLPGYSIFAVHILRRRRILTPEMPLQQYAGLVPIALCSALGGTLKLGDLREAEAAEELQIDELRETRLERAKGLERLGDAFELVIRCGAGGKLSGKRSDFEASSTLLRAAAADIVDEQAAHCARGIRQEASAV